jgi:SAM-dependent methyltransferase
MNTAKAFIKSLLPRPVLKAVEQYRARQRANSYTGLSTQQAFSKAYEKGEWGLSSDPSQRFFSGLGTHDSETSKTYLDAVKSFLSTFTEKPDVVDLGCGDFYIGSNIRPYCGRYTACDIVPALIEFNKDRFKSMDVDFRVLDLTEDELPDGDVVFIRQVLQHLSNEQIKKALPRISSKYKYLVLTEHLPHDEVFTHNLDKQAGPGPHIRAHISTGVVYSGIVVTSPPFDLKVKEERHLCEVRVSDGRIRTTLYRLR